MSSINTHSEHTGKAFEHCSMCEELLEQKLYFVEKAYEQNPETLEHFVLFEYALCQNCKQQSLSQISKESMNRIREFMDAQQEELAHSWQLMENSGLEHCAFTGTPLQEMKEFHLVAAIENGRYRMKPMIVGPHTIQKYQDLLSDHTQQFFDDFFNDFVDIPPALAKILEEGYKPVFL
ncbi:MAG: hypothetical protein Q4F57_06235 [Weeksellaceae bacterium]|nr:hypothetical protein [Weeksellaceae bacterium]